MTNQSKPLVFETPFATYTAVELIGEGGSGKVFAATDAEGSRFAIKELRIESISGDKRKRFKNEIWFLSKNIHANIVRVLDHGYRQEKKGKSLFYVMPHHESNLTKAIAAGIPPSNCLKAFSQILDGVEAAHLKNVVHRDLKPANVLCDNEGTHFSVADFGIARFLVDQLTEHDTRPQSRLANFQYAAPEQRSPGRDVGIPADIYALGLMLNELYTGEIPHGSGYRLIGQVAPEFSFLDAVVESMIRQDPAGRPASIAAVKLLIQKHAFDSVTRQKLSAIEQTVIPEGEVDDPLAHEPPRIAGATWEFGTLKISLDRPVHQRWVSSLQNHMGSYQSVWGIGPERFHFTGNLVAVSVDEHNAQQVINHFKEWLPKATIVLRHQLEGEIAQRQRDERERLRREREHEEAKLRVNSSLTF
jgi:serine/threonine protein kinase